MESKSIKFALLLTTLPLLLFIGNSLIMRFLGIGFSEGYFVYMDKPYLFVFGLTFSFCLNLPKVSSLSRQIGFTCFCLLLSCANLFLSSLTLSLLTTPAFAFLFLFLTFFANTFVLGIILAIGLRGILGINLSSNATFRILLACFVLEKLLVGFSYVSTPVFAVNYVLVTFFGVMLVFELWHIYKDESKLTYLVPCVLIVGTYVFNLLLINYAETLTLNSGRRLVTTVEIPLELGFLHELKKPENITKLRAFLEASPLWRVTTTSFSRYKASRRIDSSYPYMEESLHIFREKPYVEVKIELDEVKQEDAIPFPVDVNEHGKTYQNIEATNDTATLLVFEERFGSRFRKRGEINAKVRAKPITVTLSEGSASDYGTEIRTAISTLKKELSEIPNLTIEQISDKFSVKDNQVGKCFYRRSPESTSNYDVWGYVNVGSPGQLSVSIDGKSSYSKESIGWSSEKERGFYFSDRVYYHSTEGEPSLVELEFFPDRTDGRYYGVKGEILQACEIYKEAN